MVSGDLTEEDELEMVKHYRNTDVLKCDILKVAHHGSKTSSSEAFLDAADPDIAVISVGLNNLYGHPHAVTLQRLEEKGIPIYRTDLNGAVGIDIRKGRVIKADTVRKL
jgi:competence protein ComEC